MGNDGGGGVSLLDILMLLLVVGKWERWLTWRSIYGLILYKRYVSAKIVTLRIGRAWEQGRE